MDFDNILQQIGGYGKYQKTRFLFCCLPSLTVICFGAFVLIFEMKTPDHRCAYPESLPDTWPNGSKVDDSIYAAIYTPAKDGYTDFAYKCLIYDYSNLETGLNRSDSDGLIEAMIAMSDSAVRNMSSCLYGLWIDHSEWDENIVMRYHLLCDRSSYIFIIYLMGSIGGVLGVLVMSTLQDRVGRKFTFFLAIGWYIVTSLLSLVAPNWWSYAIVVLLKGFAISSCFQIPWLISLELVGPGRQTMVLVYNCICFSLAAVALAIVAYLCRTWLELTLITTMPSILLFGYVKFIDESGRWLFATGRIRQAKELLLKISAINSADLPLEKLESFIAMAEKKVNSDSLHFQTVNSSTQEVALDQNNHLREPTLANTEIERRHEAHHTDNQKSESENIHVYGFWSLFSSLNLIAKTLIISVIISANVIVYSGFNLNIENYGFNQYILFGATSLVEIPAALACYLTSCFGKLTPTSLSMILAGIFSIGSGFISQANMAGTLFCAVMSKLFITYSFDIIYLVAGENFPTVVRASGMGVTSIMASLFNLGTPFIIMSASTISRSSPMYIFGSIAIFAGLLGLLLPEMTGVHLLDSLEQGREHKVGINSFWQNIIWSFARNQWQQKRQVAGEQMKENSFDNQT